MSNPIFNSNFNSSNNQQSNSIFGMWNQVRNSPDPETAMQNLIATNPQLQQIMNYINQNGGDAKSAFYNMAAQKGIDPNTILSQLK